MELPLNSRPCEIRIWREPQRFLSFEIESVLILFSYSVSPTFINFFLSEHFDE